jgi:hypothetical protein
MARIIIREIVILKKEELGLFWKKPGLLTP